MKSFTNGCRRARRAKAYAMDRQSCPMNSGGLLRGKRRRGEGEIVSKDSVCRRSPQDSPGGWFPGDAKASALGFFVILFTCVLVLMPFLGTCVLRKRLSTLA